MKGHTSFIADLHVHGRFSRATSKSATIAELDRWARRKGIAVVGTGDFTHPGWREDLEDLLVPDDGDLFRCAPGRRLPVEGITADADVRFVLQTEISSIYKRHDKVRKVHNLVFVPTMEAARRLVTGLEAIGNLGSDGRPILGLDSRDLLEMVLSVDDRAFLIPAHVWTPWFSLFGSKSGFDTIEACYGDLAHHIFALETGLSSDPAMNWRVSALDGYTLVSNSDAHSPKKLGREANLLSSERTFDGIRHALATGDGFDGTIEFFPEEGKYHLDGHRKCSCRLSPAETERLGGRCPSCGKPVTVGVLHRVEELADRPEGYHPTSTRARPFTTLVPLDEVVGQALGVGAGSKRVTRVVEALTTSAGPELAVLTEVPLEDIAHVAGTTVADAIDRVRLHELTILPGFDGEFGTISIFDDDDEPSLFEPLGLVGPPPPPASPPFHGDRGEAVEARGVALPPRITTAQSAPLVPEELACEEDPLQLGLSLAGPTSPRQALLDDLDEAQRHAVEAPAGPLCLVAGPGTGKTRTVTTRIARRILDGEVLPEEVLAVTFTTKAAAELRGRLAAMLPDEADARGITVSTLHALALAVLTEAREEGPLFVIDGDDRRAVERALARARRVPAIRLVNGGESGRADAEPPVELLLRDLGAVPLDSLLPLAVELLEGDEALRARWRARWTSVTIDELQDLDDWQHRLVEAITAPGADVTVIGDPDQAVYGFRGATADGFDRFMARHQGAHVVALGTTYRSTEAIMVAASEVLAPVASGTPTPVAGKVTGTERLELFEATTADDEAAYVARRVEQLLGGIRSLSFDADVVDTASVSQLGLGDIAILARTSALLDPVEAALGELGLPTSRATATRLLDDPDLAHLSLWLRLLGRDDDVVALVRLMADLGVTVPLAPDTTEAYLEAGVPSWRRAASSIRGRTKRHREAHAMLHLIGRLASQRAHASPLEVVTAVIDVALAHRPETVRRRTMEQMTLLCRARAPQDLPSLTTAMALATGADVIAYHADTIPLLTMHAAKGLEFSHVFIVGAEDGLTPFKRRGAEVERPDEERRLFYVAMTRAAHHLVITRATTRRYQGRTLSLPPAPYLEDIAQSLRGHVTLPKRVKPHLAREEQLALL